MRGQVAFSWFATDPRVATLPAADVGGLALLLAHWWAAGSLPADDDSLAALSRLGAAWAGSRLRSVLATFFEAAGDALRSIDLAPVREADEAVRAKRRKAGQASAAARCRTPVEHVLNTCSTHVQQVFNGEANGRTKSNDANDLGRERLAMAAAAAEAARIPPHTPLIERAKKCHSSLKGGEGGDDGQLDLFGGEPERPRPKPKRSAGSQEQLRAAADLVDDYVATVATAHRRTLNAERNVAHWLAKGVPAADFKKATRNYAAYCDRLGRAAQYRMAPHRFFGVKDPEFRSFLKEIPVDATSQPFGNPGGSSRVRDERNDYSEVVRVIKADVAFATPDAAGHHEAPARAEVDPGNPFRIARGAG